MNGKQAAVEATLVTSKIYFASISEVSKVNCKRRAPPMKDYVSFRKLDPRQNRGSVLYMQRDYERSMLRISQPVDNDSGSEIGNPTTTKWYRSLHRDQFL